VLRWQLWLWMLHQHVEVHVFGWEHAPQEALFFCCSRAAGSALNCLSCHHDITSYDNSSTAVQSSIHAAFCFEHPQLGGSGVLAAQAAIEHQLFMVLFMVLFTVLIQE
jgi:hypothetical protein